jgi:hypothetical protein
MGLFRMHTQGCRLLYLVCRKGACGSVNTYDFSQRGSLLQTDVEVLQITDSPSDVVGRFIAFPRVR